MILGYRYTVYEWNPGENGDEKRFIWSFDTYEAAMELRCLIEERDPMPCCITIESHPVTDDD